LCRNSGGTRRVCLRSRWRCSAIHWCPPHRTARGYQGPDCHPSGIAGWPLARTWLAVRNQSRLRQVLRDSDRRRMLLCAVRSPPKGFNFFGTYHSSRTAPDRGLNLRISIEQLHKKTGQASVGVIQRLCYPWGERKLQLRKGQGRQGSSRVVLPLVGFAHPR
jgi:hypothetical protein